MICALPTFLSLYIIKVCFRALCRVQWERRCKSTGMTWLFFFSKNAQGLSKKKESKQKLSRKKHINGYCCKQKGRIRRSPTSRWYGGCDGVEERVFFSWPVNVLQNFFTPCNLLRSAKRTKKKGTKKTSIFCFFFLFCLFFLASQWIFFF